MMNKVAIVTGAAMGIGRAHAELLLTRQAKVCIADMNSKTGVKTEKSLQDRYGLSNIFFTKCDVTKEAELRNVFLTTKEKFGQIDIVVNNAGIMDESRDMLMLDINLKAVIMGTKLGLEFMGKPNGGNGGVVINMASTAGLRTISTVPMYTAVKHAVLGYSTAIGEISVKTHGVRVNCICPSYTDTTLLTEAGPETLFGTKRAFDIFKNYLAKTNLMSPSKVAECLVPLIEDESLTGQAMICCEEYPQSLLNLPKTDQDTLDFYVKGRL